MSRPSVAAYKVRVISVFPLLQCWPKSSLPAMWLVRVHCNLQALICSAMPKNNIGCSNQCLVYIQATPKYLCSTKKKTPAYQLGARGHTFNAKQGRVPSKTAPLSAYNTKYARLVLAVAEGFRIILWICSSARTLHLLIISNTYKPSDHRTCKPSVFSRRQKRPASSLPSCKFAYSKTRIRTLFFQTEK
jgi:hypothetical protein